MRPWTVQLAAMLLLLAQTMFGMVGGRVVCIQVEPCEAHAHGPLHHGCPGTTLHVPGVSIEGEAHHDGHDHAVASSDCDCHLHVALPADDHAPSRSGGDARSSACGVLAAAWCAPSTIRLALIRRSVHEPPRACWVSSGLRSTRLTV
jgi:hypothetical protein